MSTSPMENPHARPHHRPDAADYRYVDRYPHLSDLLEHGGTPGVRYALVSAARIGHYQSRLQYMLVARLPAITIEVTQGAHAGVHAAMLMCCGNPIAGAQPGGSVRIFDIDPQLDDATGLGPARPAGSKVPPKAVT